MCAKLLPFGRRSHRTGWRRHLLVATLCAASLASGCTRPPSPIATTDGTSTETANADDADPKSLGHVEFTGPADTAIIVANSSGRTAFSGEIPCEVDLQSGSYTWSARFPDNQRIEDRPLHILVGDDQIIRVEWPRAPVPLPGEEAPATSAPKDEVRDFNKPWLPTDPLVPVDRPYGAPKSGLRKTAPGHEGGPAPGSSSDSGVAPPRSPESDDSPKPRSSSSDAD